ncbi:hypothetical protein DFS34DRAFT_615183 [Phlyctochytrium arcticum]|nr:hypothetical protein DFS34DRAFT_615183 [Phlyctochytrium arcticum]
MIRPQEDISDLETATDPTLRIVPQKNMSRERSEQGVVQLPNVQDHAQDEAEEDIIPPAAEGAGPSSKTLNEEDEVEGEQAYLEEDFEGPEPGEAAGDPEGPDSLEEEGGDNRAQTSASAKDQPAQEEETIHLTDLEAITVGNRFYNDLDALHRMRMEQEVHLEEVQSTRNALFELQQKRDQLEFVRTNLSEALSNNDLEALNNLYQTVDGIEASIGDHLEQRGSSTRAHNIEIDQALDELESETDPAIDSALNDIPIEDLMQLINTLPPDDLANNPALAQLLQLKDMYETRQSQLQQLQNLREQYAANEMRAEEQIGLFAERQKELSALKMDFEDVKQQRDAPKPNILQQLRDQLENGPDEGQDLPFFATVKPTASTQAQASEITALQDELRMLQELKQNLDEKKRAMYASANVDQRESTSATVRHVETSTPAHKTRNIEAAGAPVRGHQQNSDMQNEEMADRHWMSGIGQLMDRLSLASVKDGVSQTPAKKIVANLFGMSADNGVKQDHQQQRRAGKQPESPEEMEGQEEKAHIERGMQELLQQMNTIEQARVHATGPQKVQLDDLYSRLEAQYNELKEVQEKLGYFRRMLAMQQAAGEPDQLAEEEEDIQSEVVPQSQPQQSEAIRAQMPTRTAWVERAKVDEHAIDDETTQEQARPVWHAQASSSKKEDQIEPHVKQLFEAHKDKIYRCAASLISQQECDPNFLIQMFKGAEKLGSPYLRQRLLLFLDELLEESEAFESAKKVSGPMADDTPPEKFGVDKGKKADLSGEAATPAQVNPAVPRRRWQRSAAPSPSISPQRPDESAPFKETRGRSPTPRERQEDIDDEEDIVKETIARVISYISRLPTSTFQPAHLTAIRHLVVDLVDASMGISSWPPVHQGFSVCLDGLLRDFENGDVVETGGSLVDAVADAVEELEQEYLVRLAREIEEGSFEDEQLAALSGQADPQEWAAMADAIRRVEQTAESDGSVSGDSQGAAAWSRQQERHHQRTSNQDENASGGQDIPKGRYCVFPRRCLASAGARVTEPTSLRC